jgi:hypothetical protein
MPVIQFILQRNKYFKPGKNVVGIKDFTIDDLPSLANIALHTLKDLDLSSYEVSDEGHIEIELGNKRLIGIIAPETDWHLFDKLLAAPLADNDTLLAARRDPISMLGIAFHFNHWDKRVLLPHCRGGVLESLIDDISSVDVSSVIDFDHPILLSSTDKEKAKPLSALFKPFDPEGEGLDDYLKDFEIIEDAETRGMMVHNIIARVDQLDDATSKQKVLRVAYDSEKISTHRDANFIKKPLNTMLKPLRNLFIFWKDDDVKNRAPIETNSQKRIAEELEQVKADTNNPLTL